MSDSGRFMFGAFSAATAINIVDDSWYLIRKQGLHARVHFEHSLVAHCFLVLAKITTK